LHPEKSPGASPSACARPAMRTFRRSSAAGLETAAAVSTRGLRSSIYASKMPKRMTAAVSPAARAPLVRAACLLTLTTAQCGDPSNSAPELKASWQLVFQELQGALISVAGTSENDVWLAGSDPQDGRGALVLHYDGVEFERLELGVEVDLWWVHAFERDLVFFGGADGTIVKYDGMDFTRMTTPGTGTI